MQVFIVSKDSNLGLVSKIIKLEEIPIKKDLNGDGRDAYDEETFLRIERQIDFLCPKLIIWQTQRTLELNIEEGQTHQQIKQIEARIRRVKRKDQCTTDESVDLDGESQKQQYNQFNRIC